MPHAVAYSRPPGHEPPGVTRSQAVCAKGTCNDEESLSRPTPDRSRRVIAELNSGFDLFDQDVFSLVGVDSPNDLALTSSATPCP